MKTKFLIAILVSLLVISVVSASFLVAANNKIKEKERGIEKIVFIHYRKDFGKPGNVCGNGVCEPGEKKTCPEDCPSNGNGETACYKFLKGRAKWQWQEDYYVFSGVEGNAVSLGVAEWENYAGNIFGQQISEEKSFDEYDEFNAITYGDFVDDCEILYGFPCAIAVTAVWIWGNKIVEYDIIFDSDFEWGNVDTTINATVMDWQNIATHELGHAAGMNDLYETECIEETMYGYSNYGEIKKRTLNTGDIAGIQKLYS